MDYEALQAENGALKTRILELENSYQEAIKSHKEDLAELHKLHLSNVEQLQNALDQIEQLKRIIYGRKSERYVPMDNQLNLFSGEVEQASKESEQKTQQIPSHERKVKKSKHKGRTLLSQCGWKNRTN